MRKTFTLLAALSGIAIASPVLADADDIQKDKAGIEVDENAIAKDNAVIDKHEGHLHKHRVAKAAAKAEGDPGKQAVESTKIGAHKAAIAEKKTERAADRKILEHDKKELNEDRTDAATGQ